VAHYVAASRTKRAELNLLLLLTALFASLTGTGPGERAVRQAQDVTVVRAAEAVQAAVDPARHMVPAVVRDTRIAIAQPLYPQARTAPLASRYLPFERRLE